MASSSGSSDAGPGVEIRSAKRLAGFAGFALGKVLSLIEVRSEERRVGKEC